MRRRLFEGPEQGLGEAIVLLEAVRPPSRGSGLCSLIVCLQSALEAVGEAVSYARLMGQTGAAFMLRLAAGFPAAAALEGREQYAVQALTELGHTPQLLQAPDRATTLALCRTECAAGRPLVALGWGAPPGEGALIVGVQGEDLLGHAYGATGRPRRHPPTPQLLLALGASRPPLPGAAAAVAALTRSLELLAAGTSQYDGWLALLAEDEPYGPALGRLERFVAEQWLSACLADARDAAAEYLAGLAGVLGDDEADPLAAAGECAQRLAAETERLLVPPEAVQRAHLPEDLDWRQRRCEVLRRLQADEARLRGRLREALRVAGDETLWGE